MKPLVRACQVEPLQSFRVRVTFEDGTQAEKDLAPYLHGPIFDPIKTNPSLFRAVKVVGGALTWDNGADIDPDVLYYGLVPAWAAEEQARA
jgi:hypothetical protein